MDGRSFGVPQDDIDAGLARKRAFVSPPRPWQDCESIARGRLMHRPHARTLMTRSLPLRLLAPLLVVAALASPAAAQRFRGPDREQTKAGETVREAFRD